MVDLLFAQYIDVINRIIGENRDGIYGKAAKLWAMTFGDELVAVGIYKDDASKPFRWYTVQLSGGRVALLETRRNPDARMSWRIRDVHLVRVVESPDEYATRPLKLDLDWLRTRLGWS